MTIEKRGVMVTGQLETSKWHDIVGAILDAGLQVTPLEVSPTQSTVPVVNLPDFRRVAGEPPHRLKEGAAAWRCVTDIHEDKLKAMLGFERPHQYYNNPVTTYRPR